MSQVTRASARGAGRTGTRVRFGAGAAQALPGILARRGARRVLLVSGEGSYAASGARRLVEERLGDLRLRRFSGFAANPRLEDLERGVRLAREEDPDLVLGIGGGTAMDLAKLVAVLADAPGEPADYALAGRPLAGRRRRGLVLAPTTAGTGSEVTRFGVVYAGVVKHSLDHPSLAADDAVVDPELTASMPPRLTAVTGMDVLCQAVESYWSVRSSERSRRLAGRALRLVLDALEPACLCPTPAARSAMSRAALWTGRAIDLTRTTAPHAVSYALTGLFGIPHGHACALTLPRFFLYNAAVSEADLLDPRGVGFVHARLGELLELLGAATAEAACGRIEALMRRLGLATRLADLGLDAAARERILALGANAERAGNNPRRLTPGGLRDIVESIA